MTADESAQWMVHALQREADRTGVPLAPSESAFLTREVTSLSPDERAAAAALHNRVVHLARSAMEHGKAQGAPVAEARPGLVIPSDWLGHYTSSYGSNQGWVVSAIMQSAMTVNPTAGETSPWMSAGPGRATEPPPAPSGWPGYPTAMPAAGPVTSGAKPAKAWLGAALLIGFLVGAMAMFFLKPVDANVATGDCEQLVRTASRLLDADKRYWQAEVDSTAEYQALEDEKAYFDQLERDLDHCPPP